MNLDYQLSNGRWFECGSRSEEFLYRAIKYNPTKTKEEIIQQLNEGKEIKHGSDWYDQVRNSDIAKAQKAALEQRMSNYKPKYESVEEFDARSDEA
jgi:hypothetical protein